MNSVLLKEMKEKTADMQVIFYRSEDYKKIIMLNSVQENSKFRFHRDGKLKHAEVASGLLECGYNLPEKYVVERDEEQDCWGIVGRGSGTKKSQSIGQERGGEENCPEEEAYIMGKLHMTSDFYYELKEELKTDMLVYIDAQS